MEPLVSVIVPIYKVENYLRQCVDSILTQTYTNLEIILVDDGSPDSCGAICDEYAERDARICVIHKPNGGQSDARNAGLRKATGKFIAFVDGDDWLDEDYLMHMYRRINGCDIAICGFKYVDTEGNQIGSCMFNDVIVDVRVDEENIERLIRNSALGFVWNKLYDASLIRLIEFEPLMPREDLIFNMIALSNANKIAFDGSFTGYNWVQHLTSTTHSINSSYVEKTKDIHTRLLEVVKQSDLRSKWRIYDYTMKVLLSDTVLAGIINNHKIGREEKMLCLRELVQLSNNGMKLIYNKNDPRYFKLLYCCFKVKSVTALYYLSYLMMRFNRG